MAAIKHKAVHCARRGGNSWSHLYEHLFSSFWPFCSRPATGHTMHTSDLDLWLNSTPFWCKNHFCSLKTEGFTKIFLATNIFPMTSCSVKASPTVQWSGSLGCQYHVVCANAYTGHCHLVGQCYPGPFDNNDKAHFVLLDNWIWIF